MKKRFKKIYIEITNQCNLNCSFCSKTSKSPKFLSVDEFKIIINKIKNFTDYIYLHIKGEPLIHPYLNEFLKLCQRNNIKVNITTNGSLINSKKEILFNNSIHQINFSLHSENTLNIENYLNSIFEFTEEALKRKIIVSYRFWTLNKSSLKQSMILSIIDNYYKLGGNIYDSLSYKIRDNLYLNKDYEFIWPSMSNSYYNDKGTCYGTRDHIGILSDGTVIPCCLDADGIISLGNIFNENMSDIINSSKFNNILLGFQNKCKKEELCKHCQFL